MVAGFLRGVPLKAKLWTLFVKKSNLPAAACYRHTGFKTLADYSIVYF
jgi:predicted GNAT family acetyltransferase